MTSLRVPEGRQPLIVPWSRRADARGLGALWHADIKAWSVPLADAARTPRELLPIRDRPGLDPPYIRINLIPQSSWGRNLRSMMTPDQWRSFKRERVYSTTGSLCLVCGGRGPEWPVEADEVWQFDDAKGVQRLAAVVPLCPDCHEVRSAGLATTNGRAEIAARHLAWVERDKPQNARRRIADSLTVWQKRSRRRWSIDLAVMEHRYGMVLAHDDAKTQDVHDELVADARRRARRRRP